MYEVVFFMISDLSFNALVLVISPIRATSPANLIILDLIC
jgi:hypothetical protein